MSAQQPPPRPRRLFFALWPSEELRTKLFDQTRDAVSESRGRAVPSRNLHVTLAFIGAVEPARVAALQAAADRVCAAPFEFQLDQLESWRPARVACLTARDAPAALLDLAARLHQELSAEGFLLDERPYRAHVTLARDVRSRPPVSAFPPLRWRVDDFVLVESNRGRDGSAYEVIAHWPLQNGAAAAI